MLVDLAPLVTLRQSYLVFLHNKYLVGYILAIADCHLGKTGELAKVEKI